MNTASPGCDEIAETSASSHGLFPQSIGLSIAEKLVEFRCTTRPASLCSTGVFRVALTIGCALLAVSIDPCEIGGDLLLSFSCG